MADNSSVSLIADRYASVAMREIFAPEAKIVAERRLWIAVMRAQSALGHEISPDVITAYESVITRVDLASIDAREKQTRHDVKARIEEFNALAGHEAIHAGMTSRDVTENIEALQIRNGLEIIHNKVVTLLARLAERATQYADQPIAGRSHNVPAQITTLGKRFASTAEELLFAYERLSALQARFPMRGIKGPVGTSQDSIDLLGSSDAHAHLESEIAKELGFTNVLDSTGQIYPRSFDYDVVTTLVQIAAAPSSLATYGAPKVSSAFSISALVVHVKLCAVGTPASDITSLAKVFDPSNCAAAFDGPNTAIFNLRRSSATPLTNGTSGPMTTKSAPISCARATICALLVISIAWHCANSAIPGLPGAT